MKKLLFLLLAIPVYNLPAFAQVNVQHLLTENQINPIGIDQTVPRFSWQLVSDKRNVLQTAYEIRVLAGKSTVWSSGRVSSAQSVQVSYAGGALQSGEWYNWQVRVWDNEDKASAWSAPADFQMGLLNKSDWKAKWISPGFTEDSVNRPAVLFRKGFSLAKKVATATAYITSHGMYEAKINGRRVGDAYLTPGWTSYKKRLQYQVYDVTSLLVKGENAVGVSVGNGWYRGFLAWSGNKNSFGSDASLLFQLAVTYSDGSRELVVSDDSWKSSTGAIRYAEIYHGETVDARYERSRVGPPPTVTMKIGME